VVFSKFAKMKISVNWLKSLVPVEESAQQIADRLSVSGLEVEHIEEWESLPGGLKGFVVGQVLTCEKHPDADRLSVTTVDVGTGESLNIVCGAPNVATGQKVVVATVGTEVRIPGK
jgi:phenylalanyl-tRNA synthetase beta chain